MLATLGLEAQPAAEVIPMTVQVWLKAICRNRVFDQAQDIPRIREAFAMLAERSHRWPSPSDFIASLPSNVVPFQKPARLEDERRRKAGFHALSEINKILRIPPPRDDNGPEAA